MRLLSVPRSLSVLLCLLALLVAPLVAAQPKPAPKPADKPAPAQPKPAPAPAPAPKGGEKGAAEDEKKKEEAGKYYGDAQKQFKDGKYEEALALYQKADDTWPGAAPKYKIAECYDKLGKSAEAVAGYKAFLATDPGEKFQEKIDTANQRIGELEGKLPAKVTVAVAPADAANLSISVDGNKIEGTSIELSPGEHTIIVTADGFQPKTEVVSVKGGQPQDVTVTLTPVAKPAPKGKTPPKPKKPPVPQEPKEERSNIPAYVTLGIAGAGIILGAVFGIQALSAKSDFDDDPTTDNADAAERAALIADMSFGVALTFGITGAVLLFSGGDDDAEETPADTGTLPDLTPYAGTTGGGVSATWRF